MTHGRRKEGGRLKENVREMGVGGGRDGEDERTRVLGEHPTPKTCVSKPKLPPNMHRHLGLMFWVYYWVQFELKRPKNQRKTLLEFCSSRQGPFCKF